ncbi:hypothetical protein [Sphingobacterium humi]|uniref:Uncharacterized protein n=1 Tax=Sphingobacterium humi TaxID=1796905 RepID=A0A6N8L346_9SPHI|nr:hypothetical protein [Sphingobacterium humi]MVZ63766.1 hypothetical protein [Sphingobacterium humi]
MSLYPFTPQGVADFLTSLYASTDPNLALEAAAVESDFAAYVADHFDLTSEQEAYLTAMPETAKSYLGDRCGFCFTHRLPIELIKPAEPSGSYSKIIETKDKTQTQIIPPSTFIVSGSFIIEIIYTP